MKKQKVLTFNVDGEEMTVREIMLSRRNIHDLNDGQIRGRLAAGYRSLANILRPLNTVAVSEAKKPTVRNDRDVYNEFVQAIEVKYISDGSTAEYYKLPENAKELQDLISAKNMNGQIAEIFRACYRYGEVGHSPKLRDAKKMRFYIDAEIARLEKYETS